MRLTIRPMIVTVLGLTVASTLLGAGAASATVATDPSSTPAKSDLVGVGSDTTQDVVGLAGSKLKKSGIVANFNATDPDQQLWSFDAFGSASIVPAEGCAEMVRPNGSSAGVAALKADQSAGLGCIDYARSSRVKNPATDGDLVFVPFARDGVTWAAFPKSAGSKKSNAPADLSTAELASIYSCTVTNWKQVGGKNAAIKPYLPQSGSGTRSFWLAAIGVATPGACVNQPAGFPENDGSAVPAADRAGAIIPYSIAKHIAQSKGVGEDVRAKSTVRKIDGASPVVKNKLNPDFAPAFLRQVFNVIKPADQGTEAFDAVFATDGFICSNPKIVETFGFGKLTGASCGY